jgi:hypothetical protein
MDQSNLPLAYVKRFKTLMTNLTGLNQSELLQEYRNVVQENYPIMAAYIFSRLPEGIMRNEPPHIGDITISEVPVNNDMIVANVTDPGGDMAIEEFKVSHQENGQVAVDQPH